MANQLLARGQATIQTLNDAYTINQSVSSYVFAAASNGAVISAVTVTSTIKIMMGDINVTNFTIGTVTKPTGFSAITVNNTSKTITYTVAANTTNLPDTGVINIPVTVAGNIYNLSFAWSKTKDGATGPAGVDANMLDWVADWNTNKTVIGTNSVITPKIFAGVKNANGTITGIALGRFPLSALNASGTVVTETVDGIYGFRDGNKTFFIDNGGNAQLGRGNQYIKYNAVTGKVEFGSEVSLNWMNAIGTAQNAAISAAATDATNKINSLQIGIRNYIKNSAFAVTGISGLLTVDGVTAVLDTATKYQGYNTIKITQTAATGTSANTARAYFTALKQCNPASFSMWIKASAATSLRIRIGGTGAVDIPVDTAWKRIKLENTVPTSLVVLFGATTAGVVYNIALPMLVEATKAADWSPAPEDLYDGINNAQAVADAITKKANDEKWQTKLTYIDATGIFTGTLSANTVNAIAINASQITAGTINAARIDVASLKASLITAANINALTLAVNKGTIGGWSIDADSIFRGAKNNTSGGYTAASGAITIGSNGIRGFKWKLDSTGAGAIAGGNISWDATGNVTFGSSVSLNWTTPINSITTALGGSSYSKLTEIDATGIYTGTLTATQVNAVSINAASIKTGTLSADRIAAGSINATKLDAASIKSGIINTDYINGLTCTFVRGKIGGWTIGADHITAGSVGATGQMPVQIRSAAAGSGYWYNGAYKPQGIVMTWHQSGNAGHFVFGQIAASGNSVKTGFIGIQMLAWDNTEYFCLSANSTLSGSKEVYNRIAGWAFDNDTIFRGTKNNTAGAYTSASGAISLGSNGIRGFKWRLDATGAGAVAGGNISWDASGNVTFAASVSLNWTTPINSITTALGGSSYGKLTKIDATGIYTGTLTATQVNAVSIDAASIKTGTLSADRIAAGSINATKLDAASIKSGIINTDYINGLTCTFVRGKIGGWTINSGSLSNTHIVLDNANKRVVVYGANSGPASGQRTQLYYNSDTDFGFLATNASGSGVARFGSSNNIASWTVDTDSLFRGTKNNTSGAYTSGSGHITLGANGIRGYKWRLESTGAGAIAGGNISWDAAGNVTFASSVSLNWTSQIDAAKELASAMAGGKMLYRDPTFYNGNNGVNVYNNSGNGTVTITRTADTNAPNDSKVVLLIKNTGVSSPNCGGFHFATQTSYRKVFITRIIAKIPAGRNISFHTNSMGTGGIQKWLTPVAGTGDWCEYICKVSCGTADFSSTHFFALTGAVGTAEAPVEWRVAYATVFDITSTEKYTTTIDANGIYTGTVRASQIQVDSALVVGGSSYNGSISVRDAANSIKVTLDRTGITAVGGTIGGWTIASNQISKNSVILSSDGSITNGARWKLNNDGSGQFANGNISWTAAGTVTVTGTINASAGTIGGFEIGYGRIGSAASGSGSGGGLAIYNDLFRVGSSTSYVLFGDDTFPATAGGAFTATGRITNNKSNTYSTNCGIYIDVKNATRNFGIYSNAALLAPALISNRIKTVVFSGTGYSINFSQNNLFFIYATTNCSITLPAESSVTSMFGVSSLPSDFACVFTLVYNYNYGNRITINSIRNNNGALINHNMAAGDILTLLCAKFPSFHYQIINLHS